MADLTAAEYQRQRARHWDDVARKTDAASGLGGYYHERIRQVYSQVIPPGQRVLELGCARGDLLAALRPSFGVGVDFSPEMITRAKSRHAELHFIQADVHTLELDQKFDVIVLADLVNDAWDVQAILERVRAMSHPRTRLVMNYFSRLWEVPLAGARRLHAAAPIMQQNWLANEDVVHLLDLAGFQPVRRWQEILWPIRTPGIDAFMNRFVARLWPLKHLALTNIVVARPQPSTADAETRPRVSVIVPARNEAGNIPAIFDRVPDMGGETELIFVEGHSSDQTAEAIEREIAARPHKRAKLFRQTGKGKGDAVRLGFANATGDIFMILDADLTVAPEDLPRFYEALRTRRGEIINGSRLVYPMERQSMQSLNLIANKFFGQAFSWVLGQSIRDTLCGTKALHKVDYDLIAANRAYFGEFDPFGDFDLLFGAARLNMKILDLPVRYRQRTYGTTNISRFTHGWLLFKMLITAARKIKFI